MRVCVVRPLVVQIFHAARPFVDVGVLDRFVANITCIDHALHYCHDVAYLRLQQLSIRCFRRIMRVKRAVSMAKNLADDLHDLPAFFGENGQSLRLGVVEFIE